jgi:FixJ family two-component response regulator
MVVSSFNQSVTPWSGSNLAIKPVPELFVVDDDEEARELLVGTLAPEGFPVRTFEDGDSFLATARTRVPICVFLDVIMPRRSGLEILRELRAQDYWTPTFLISGQDDFPTVVEAMRSGAHDYIKKPFDRYAPLLRVREALALWTRRERERTAESLCLSPSERDALLFNRVLDAYSADPK